MQADKLKYRLFNNSQLTSWHGQRDGAAVSCSCRVLGHTDKHTTVWLPSIGYGQWGIVDVSIAVTNILSSLGKSISGHTPVDKRNGRVTGDEAVHGHRGSNEDGVGCLTDRNAGDICKSECMIGACHVDELSIAVLSTEWIKLALSGFVISLCQNSMQFMMIDFHWCFVKWKILLFISKI